MPRRLALIAVLIAVALLLAHGSAHAQTDTGYSVDSFDVLYDINTAGGVAVTENITVTFETPHHGIFRYVPTESNYDSGHYKRTDLTNVNVQSNGRLVPFEQSTDGINTVIKIGDPDKTLTGKQSYQIVYLLSGAMNPFSDHDELYWNVTGSGWDVPIEEASVKVTLPANSVQQITCYEGPIGATDPCTSSSTSDTANFATTAVLLPGDQLTIVVGTNKGVLNVPPPVLVGKPRTFAEYFQLTPLSIGITVALAVLAVVALVRLWWAQGRDRWLGNMFYLNETPSTPEAEKTKPIGAHETIVVEFTPPEVDEKTKRRLRPAEIGVLLDERADTLDVTATIVDLAVRKHLTIKETKKGGFLGLFKKKDYELTKLTPDAGDLLPYESQLKDAIFADGDVVTLSSLKNKFHDDLEKVKGSLYQQTLDDKFFPRNPNMVRHFIRIAGVVVGAIGGLIAYGLGYFVGGGLIGLAIVGAGVILLLTAGAFPRRTGSGRVLYRRSLGFRRFMTESDKAREKFAENANLFHDYLPYAIVYGCVDRWAKVFKDLGLDPGRPTYYIGPGPFIAANFAASMGSFSSSISSTMSSTPGGSGGSGFGGGGGSGGGGGGGGGGAW